MRVCVVCEEPIENRRRGAIYCGKRCAKRAQRSRQTDAAAGHASSARIEPSAVPKRQRKPSVEDVAGMFLDAKGLEGSLRFASEKADYRLRAMCARMAAAIGDAIAAEGMR